MACSRRRSEGAELVRSRFLRLRALALRCALAGSALFARPGAAQTFDAASALAERAPGVRLRYDAQPARLVTLLVMRLSAELKVAGFSVEPAPGEGLALLAEQHEPAGSYADIRVTVDGDRAELDITSRARGASSHVVLAGSEREVPALALQATEFLRAGLLPRLTPLAPALPGREAPSAKAAPPTSLAPVHGQWLLDVGGAVLGNWRAGDRLLLLSLGAGYASPQRVTVSAGLDVPLGSATFRSPQGFADYRLWFLQLHADYAWLRWRSGEASLGLGFGTARVTSVGRPLVPLEGRQPELWALALGARLSAELRASSKLACFARARVVSLSPNPLIAVLSDERRLGSPSILLELGLRIGGRAERSQP